MLIIIKVLLILARGKLNFYSMFDSDRKKCVDTIKTKVNEIFCPEVNLF